MSGVQVSKWFQICTVDVHLILAFKSLDFVLQHAKTSQEYGYKSKKGTAIGKCIRENSQTKVKEDFKFKGAVTLFLR